jgi:ribonucleoside-diphosphate reductase alpha chain
MDNQKTWSSINAMEGSVQHLDLPEDVKAVFKTAREIDQMALIQLAADRGEYVDQGQSLNLFFKSETQIKELHSLHFAAWKLGLKSLYYLRTEKIKGDYKVGKKIKRKKIEDEPEKEINLLAIADGEGCVACEG